MAIRTPAATWRGTSWTIVEVTQEAVRKPEEVVARLRAVRKSGRPRVLFLLADADGELRFVAIPIS